MSLDTLKKLETEAERLDRLAERDAESARLIQAARNQCQNMEGAMVYLEERYNAGNFARVEVSKVLDEMRFDILRIAELRLAASEREHKVKAAQKRAVIATCILPIPEESER